MQAIIVVDLGFGDAGKGSLVDYYVRRFSARTVIRFNGGAQAAHNVVTPDGRHHTFSQFGSGTCVPGVRTHLSRFMLLDPVALLQEEKHLRTVGVTDAFDRLSIDPLAPVVTPFQRAANRLRELQRGAGRHGSCGMGIGETMADMLADPSCILRAGELPDRPRVLAKLRLLQQLKYRQIEPAEIPQSILAGAEWALLRDPQAAEEFADLFVQIGRRLTIAPSAVAISAAAGTIVFEGAQGVLLDEWYGFHPYTTWSTTTFANAMTLLSESGYAGQIRRIGAIRAYLTRHGPGPFVTEDSDLATYIPDAHNGTNTWQREFRVGWPDLVMLRYALEVAGGVDELAVTCLDRVAPLPQWKVCCHYEQAAADCFVGDRLRKPPAPDLNHQQKLTAALGQCRPVYSDVDAGTYLDWLEDRLGYPIGLTSSGPTWQHKTMRGRGGNGGQLVPTRRCLCRRCAPVARASSPC